MSELPLHGEHLKERDIGNEFIAPRVSTTIPGDIIVPPFYTNWTMKELLIMEYPAWVFNHSRFAQTRQSIYELLRHERPRAHPKWSIHLCTLMTELGWGSNAFIELSVRTAIIALRRDEPLKMTMKNVLGPLIREIDPVLESTFVSALRRAFYAMDKAFHPVGERLRRERTDRGASMLGSIMLAQQQQASTATPAPVKSEKELLIERNRALHLTHGWLLKGVPGVSPTAVCHACKGLGHRASDKAHCLASLTYGVMTHNDGFRKRNRNTAEESAS